MSHAPQAMQVAQAPEVLVQRLMDDETVFLNLETEEYHGLDPVGTMMWDALMATGRTDLASERLLGTFDVDGEMLNRDLEAFIQQLVARGLLLVGDDAVAATTSTERG